MQRKDDVAGRDDGQACRLVKGRAGDVQRLIPVGLAAFEAVQAELLARDRGRQLRRARLDAAAVRCNHGDRRWARAGDDAVVGAWTLTGRECGEVVVGVYGHSSRNHASKLVRQFL